MVDKIVERPDDVAKTPQPRDSMGQVYVCPYKQEVLTVRRWTKIGWVVFPVILAASVTILGYAASIASEAGSVVSDVENVEKNLDRYQLLSSKNIEVNRQNIEKLRQDMVVSEERNTARYITIMSSTARIEGSLSAMETRDTRRNGDRRR